MAKREELEKRLNITPGVRDKHNYHRDPAFGDGRRYLMRLPDRTLVPADEYEERLREYERQAAATDGGAATVEDGDDAERARSPQRGTGEPESTS